ncbi:MAG: hypothetical protein KF708_02790 [Pirellulales bacterium]|nr:hypothetical protein [Pirellulales bacterium]
MSEEPRDTSTDLELPPPVTPGVVDVYEPATRSLRSHPAWRWIWRGSLVLAGIVAVALLGLAANGTKGLANYWLARAYGHYAQGDLPAAIDSLTDGLEWFPDDSMLVYARAQFRREHHDLAGSLQDANRLIELAPEFADGYTERAQTYLRQKRYPEAIADLTQARDLQPTGEPEPLNGLAYARALAGTDLELGLSEVQQAIDQSATSPHLYSYLDTRGYLYHLLQRHEEALADLDRAVEQGLKDRDKAVAHMQAQRLSDSQINRLTNLLNRNLAVIYHHRGEVHQALGNKEQAEFDLRRGDELGYNPEQGVF